MSKKHKIIVASVEEIDSEHKVELAHDQDKTNWYVTFTGVGYTEFTFDSEHDAVNLYNSSKKTTNLYMDLFEGGENG